MIGRVLWGLAIPLALISMHSWIAERGMNYPWGPSAWIPGLTALGSPSARYAAMAMICALTVAWVKGYRRQLAAIAAFALLLFYAHLKSTTAAHQTNEGRSDMLAGATLLAWIVGSFQSGTDEERDQLGIDMAAGVVAAAYLWAGVMKVWALGPLWAMHSGLDLLIVERGVGASGPLASLRMTVGTTPVLGGILGSIALLIELAGPLFMIRRYRLRFAAAAICMHVGIGVLMGYYYISFWVILLGIAILSNEAEVAP